MVVRAQSCRDADPCPELPSQPHLAVDWFYGVRVQDILKLLTGSQWYKLTTPVRACYFQIVPATTPLSQYEKYSSTPLSQYENN